jgi:chemotaxis response regulator CheB
MPTMLRQLVREIALSSPGVDVIAEFPGPLVDVEAVARERPDVVILGVGDASEDAVTDLLRSCVAVRVLGISSDGMRAALYEMRPFRVSLGELGRDALRAVIRPADER